MSANVQDVAKALGAHSAPTEITQVPFDYDSSHYRRLCCHSVRPDAGDLHSYADDLMYMDIQSDLFLFLLPVCLSAWQEDLMASHKSDYSGFVEQFSAALAKHVGFRDLLSPAYMMVVSNFMQDAILDKIDQERELSFSGMSASPYSWIDTIGNFGTAFPTVCDLWQQWWSIPTPGRACGVLQYASVLMYSDNTNPIFSPWNSDTGGGPPTLWETDGHIYDQSWLPENLNFLRATFTPDYVRNSVSAAAITLRGHTDSTVPEKMVSDFDDVETFVELRIEELIENLSLPLGEVRKWITM